MEEQLINRLEKNLSVINDLLNNRDREEYLFRPSDKEWSMIQVLSHLVDEEQFDFRARLFSVVDDPNQKIPGFDPLAAMAEKNFIDEDYNELLDQFMDERIKSVAMLRFVANDKWDNAYNHPKAGPLSARFFLAKWVAHDYIHIQQMNRLAYQFLEKKTKIDLAYAGNFRIG